MVLTLSIINLIAVLLLLFLLVVAAYRVDSSGAKDEHLHSGEYLRNANHKFQQEVKSELHTIEENIKQISTGLAARKVNFETFILQSSVNSLAQKIKEVEQSLKPMLDLTQRHERILSGARAKGLLGEQLVSEKLTDLPQTWYGTNVPLKNGAKARFALRAPSGRWVPIVSTWTATGLLDRLAQATDPTERTELKMLAQTEVINRARSAQIYTDKESTLGFCIVAVPDPVFDICVDIQAKLTSADIVLISYGLLVPFLLLIVNMYLKNYQAAQVLEISNILSRSNAQIEQIKNYIYEKVAPPLDIVQQQQTTYGVQNQGLKDVYEKVSQLQNEIDLLKGMIINPLSNKEIGKIPDNLQKYLTSVQESLLEGITKQNGHMPDDTIK